MPAPHRVAEDLDRFEVEKVYHRARLARDLEMWDELVACYHPDAILDISWFKGTVAEFVQASLGMKKTLKSFHEVFPGTVQLNGNRAINTNMVAIHLIADIHGVEVDCVNYCFGRLRVEKRTDRWLIAGGETIYLHDTLIPTVPGQVPEIDMAKLSAYRPSYKFLCYTLEARGLPWRDDRPGPDRPDTVQRVIDSDMAWLAGR